MASAITHRLPVLPVPCRLVDLVDFCLESSIGEFKQLIADVIDEVEVRKWLQRSWGLVRGGAVTGSSQQPPDSLRSG